MILKNNKVGSFTLPDVKKKLILKELKAGSCRGICALKLTVAVFTTARRWKQPKVHGQMNKQNVVHTYYEVLNSVIL